MKRLRTYKTKGQFNVMMLGNAAVGKSSLLLRFISDRGPSVSEPSSTVGAEMLIKTVWLPIGPVKLKFCDTSGQQRFNGIQHSYYKSCNGAIVVYDIQNRSSYEHAKDWVSELREEVSPDMVIALAGNKADIADENRAVPKTEAEQYAINNNLLFMETSAVTAMNVESLFTKIATRLYVQVKPDKPSSKFKNTDEEKDSCCCWCFY